MKTETRDLSLEKCWAIAKQSKSDIKFGAFIEKNGRISGFGCNRRATPKDRQILPWLDYCIHAEEAALKMALERKEDISGAILYVAGFFKDGRPIVKNYGYFTCQRCVKRVLIPFNLPVKVPTLSGWQELTPEEAQSSSLKFSGKNYWWNLVKNHENYDNKVNRKK